MTTQTRNIQNVRKSAQHMNTDENAVSPVIGVILMTAITVIMAAVVGAFTFGMGDGVQKTYSVAVTASQIDSNHVDILYHGGPDAQLVNYINVTIAGDQYTRWANDTVAVDSGGAGWKPAFGENDGAHVPVGTCISLEENIAPIGITPGRDHLIATATFLDGTQQVILDTYV